MLETYRKLFDLLDTREQRRFFLLMCFMIAVTFAEILGISMLLLLLNIFAEPQKMLEHDMLETLYRVLGFSDVYPFQVFLSVLVFGVVALGLAIKAAGTYAMIRYSNMRGFTLSSRLLAAYLRQPYIWLLQRNSAEITKNVLGEISQIVNRVLLPSLVLVSNLMLTSAIIVFLIIVDPIVAVVSATLITGGYLAVYVYLRRQMMVLGKVTLAANKDRFQMTQEAIGGFKEVKLLGLEDTYVNRFSIPALSAANASAKMQLFGVLPRFALEGLTFAVLIGIILTMLVRNDGDLGAAIPTLGIFAFSVMRLLPTVQNAYASFTSLRSARPVLDTVHQDYLDAIRYISNPAKTPAHQMLPLSEGLELKGVEFAYPNSEAASLQDINLTITAHHKIGIVGGTGAGKTTLVDIMLGLLVPQKGAMMIDGVEITTANMQAWRRSIGYVPQTIYLTDATIAENIAFGLAPDQIDHHAVRRAAKIAALDVFVETELPKGYDTFVGERGIRLSGGQRQRIGIARALYHDPEMLILDEATSALDNLTERAIMDAVRNIGDSKTLIMIAHRLTTVKACNQIILMNKGRVEAVGTYDELVAGNDRFRRMAEA